MGKKKDAILAVAVKYLEEGRGACSLSFGLVVWFDNVLHHADYIACAYADLVLSPIWAVRKHLR